MRIPLSRIQRILSVLFKVSLATIGVCVFVRQLRLTHFFIEGESHYEKDKKNLDQSTYLNYRI